MSDAAFTDPLGSEFNDFLYATVGEDRNGTLVTVLSTLARLGLDPWQEAAGLALGGHETARERLGSLLSGFGDVPCLGQDCDAVARKLVLLLPAHAPSRARQPTDSSSPRRLAISVSTVAAIFIFLFVLGRLVFAGLSGSGD